MILSDSNRPDQRRAHFRLQYPVAERPVMDAKGRPHQVLEIAEGGIRIVVNRGADMQVGDNFGGEIHFHDDGMEQVDGEILRLNEKLAVIKLSMGLSLHRVMLEQAYIQKKYPMFISNSLKHPQ